LQYYNWRIYHLVLGWAGFLVRFSNWFIYTYIDIQFFFFINIETCNYFYFFLTFYFFLKKDCSHRKSGCFVWLIGRNWVIFSPKYMYIMREDFGVTNELMVCKRGETREWRLLFQREWISAREGGRTKLAIEGEKSTFKLMACSSFWHSKCGLCGIHFISYVSFSVRFAKIVYFQ
jgi:hypothetical protein